MSSMMKPRCLVSSSPLYRYVASRTLMISSRRRAAPSSSRYVMSCFARALEMGHSVMGTSQTPLTHSTNDCPHSAGGLVAQDAPFWVHGAPTRGRDAVHVGGPSKQCQTTFVVSQQLVVMPASGSQSRCRMGYSGQYTPHEQLELS